MHHRRSRMRLYSMLFCMAAVGCAGSNDNGVSTGGTQAGGTTVTGGITSTGGSQSAGGSQSTGGASGGTKAMGGTSASAGNGGSTQPTSTGGTTGPTSTPSGGSGGATSSSSLAGARDAGVGGAGGSVSGGSSANRDAGPAGGVAAGGNGGKATGGSVTGGSATGGKTTGGSATGGSATGGSATGGSATGGSATGGSVTGGSVSPGGTVFSQCRFHFGTTIDQTKNSALAAQLDFYTPGWMQGSTSDGTASSICTNAKALPNETAVVVAYVAAANVKRDHNLCDCNAGCAAGDLCKYGAQYITADWAKITAAYTSYSQGIASCYGTTKPIVFEMEPDWYQYTYTTTQTQPWSEDQAGKNMGELVAALKSSLPNARFSMDASPWVGPNNGSDGGKEWYSHFDMSLFTFVNTSGGGTDASNEKIRSSNSMTWSSLHQASGKPILADTGYGVNGSSSGPDPAWNVVANINARIADGVVSISQYNPASDWATTIAGIRSQLNALPSCP